MTFDKVIFDIETTITADNIEESSKANATFNANIKNGICINCD